MFLPSVPGALHTQGCLALPHQILNRALERGAPDGSCQVSKNRSGWGGVRSGGRERDGSWEPALRSEPSSTWARQPGASASVCMVALSRGQSSFRPSLVEAEYRSRRFIPGFPPAQTTDAVNLRLVGCPLPRKHVFLPERHL